MLQNPDQIKDPAFFSYIQKELLPDLLIFESKRKTTFRHYWLNKVLHYITLLGGLACLGIGLEALFEENAPRVGIPLLAAAAIFAAINYFKIRPFFQKAEDFRDRIKDHVLPLILNHFGNFKYQPSQGGLNWDRFPNGLLPGECEYTITEDHLFHNEDSRKIDIYDLKCIYSFHVGSGKSRRKQVNLLFNGVYVCMPLTKIQADFSLLLIKDRGLLSKAGSSYHNLARAELESPAFEKHFDVFANDQIMARKIFTPAFMEKVTQFQKDLSAFKRRRRKNNFFDKIEGQHPHLERNPYNSGLRFAVQAGQLHATLPIPSEVFDTPPLSRSLLDSNWLAAVYEDIKLVYNFQALIEQARALQG